METQGVGALIFTFVDVLGRFEIFLVKLYSRTFSMVEYNVFFSKAWDNNVYIPSKTKD